MSVRAANYPVVSDCIAEVTNPTENNLRADTGALPGGIYEVLVVASQTALAEYKMQRRNVANDGNIGDELIFYGGANTCVAVPFRFEVEPDERIRCVMNADLTGIAVVSMTAQRVA